MMAFIDEILGIVLRDPFDDKSKFFKKSEYVFGPRFVLGTIFAFVGVFGLATSGLVWEFKGIELGLTALITSFIALLFSIVFLFPFANARQNSLSKQNNIVPVNTTVTHNKPEVFLDDNVKPTLTTTEEIQAQLALSAKEQPPVVFSNYSTNHLLPGNTLKPAKRKPGKSLDLFRETAQSLYKSRS